MKPNIRQQMNRYPIFSLHGEPYIDQSELFKDQQLKTHSPDFEKLAQKSDYCQYLWYIYSHNEDRIQTNNAHDPLFVHARHQKQKQKNKNYSTVTTARNSRCDFDGARQQLPSRNNSTSYKGKAISRFMGEIALSLSKEDAVIDGKATTTVPCNAHRTQKISLLKRIIEHYNIKSVERKYYSNLIKNFGLKIESVNSNDIATKKSLHHRDSITRNISMEEPATMGSTQLQQNKSVEKKINYCVKRQEPVKKGIKKSSNSFLLNKEFVLHKSRENLWSQKSDMLIEEGARIRGQISQKMRRSIEYGHKIIQKPIKIQSTTCLQDKLNKYRDFLFLINFSNKLYRDLEVDKYERTFKFYVGKGNNGNLIKSIMKKRFWFEEVDDPMKADFIWSQIKIQQIFITQANIKKQQRKQIQRLSEQILQTEPLEPVQTKQNDEQIKNQIKSQQKQFKSSKYIKFGKSKTRARDHAPQDPILKIVSSEEAKIYRQISQLLTYKKYPTFADKYKLSSKRLKPQNQTQFTIVHNHLPNNGLLGNKKALFYNMKQFCDLSGKKLSEYIPPTFHIKKGLTDQQYRHLSSTFIERRKQKLPNMWIMKPGQFSNRGQGITCTSKLEDIRQRVIQCREASKKNGKPSTLIVQQYISNPLLYNGRKFDIRVYMLITVNNGKIKGYWYQEGYVRTSSFLWNLTEMEDKYIHLTNDAVQKNCEEYGRYEPGNKLTFTDLQRYLHSLPKCGRNMEFFDAIYPKMRSIAGDTIRSTCLNLDPSRLRDNFQIFGLDFMIDQNLKVYLIQVNTNPCLQLSCPILQRIIPHMVQNAFRISIDPLFPPPSCINTDYKYSIPENALHYNKFELVYDEEEEGQVIGKMYRSSCIMDKLDDLEEDQDLYEDDGNFVDIQDK